MASQLVGRVFAAATLLQLYIPQVMRGFYRSCGCHMRDGSVATLGIHFI